MHSIYFTCLIFHPAVHRNLWFSTVTTTTSDIMSFSPLVPPESVRKALDKQAVKFVRAIKQDTRSGKTEDRILVRPTPLNPPCLPSHQVT